jgi:hypothetical protein
MSELKARMTARLTAPALPEKVADVADLAWLLNVSAADVIRDAVDEYLEANRQNLLRAKRHKAAFARRVGS